MAWLVRVLMLIPAVVAGWFVARDDARFSAVALTIALVFLVLFCAVCAYMPRFGGRSDKASKERAD